MMMKYQNLVMMKKKKKKSAAVGYNEAHNDDDGHDVDDDDGDDDDDDDKDIDDYKDASKYPPPRFSLSICHAEVWQSGENYASQFLASLIMLKNFRLIPHGDSNYGIPCLLHFAKFNTKVAQSTTSGFGFSILMTPYQGLDVTNLLNISYRRFFYPAWQWKQAWAN
ncbi:hypothetical protein PoB_002370400 [Plakobranchus ocellatus]|uniref:Uncharacterized protein n=1 Tax=Plakobranchus ocellatus TaxID=259542 RepID=A0AAV3ZPF1_9GAST|nr:hypothetical protein PoB_002370400 [Plakobranchus ocellatus]